ncbi:pectinesterase-like [Zingiber officinale]|uniref:pectinesterase-like n=1 Tax=Zingiber officinale TaxID=94328 RepID=UPI001C4C59FA|nr:pectinesterase-like [Zingiber officinale]
MVAASLKLVDIIKYRISFLSEILYLLHSIKTSKPMVPYCSRTPYPDVCSSMVNLSDSLFEQSSLTWNGFRDLLHQATLERAILAHQRADARNPNQFDEPGRWAWTDCVELLADTVGLVNQSLVRPGDNAQTWLSAAMTNQRTCRDGFLELGLTAPVMDDGELTESISNLLAVNNAMLIAADGQHKRRRRLGLLFPEWVAAADRKLLAESDVKSDLVVAKDGSGDYESIVEAVAAAAKARGNSTERFVIHVKAGVYEEYVEIPKSMENLTMTGEGIDATVVTGNRSVKDGYRTFQTATFVVSGNTFIARDMTFQNTAGPENYQAVALRSKSDHSVFYRCSFKGYQDTLYVHSQNQFYRNCDVYGTVDFIFGNAAVVFQNCNLCVRRPMSGQTNTVTAQGRNNSDETTGILIHNSVVAAASDLAPVQGSFRTYLGRPWREYSRTVVMKTELGGLIDPAGWLEWNGSFALSTLYFGEFMNTGVGANTSRRVSWSGYRVIDNSSEVENFTVGTFLSGDSWIPATGVPYTPGL